MRIPLLIGAILILLGIASFFVPVPRRERHGVDIGGVSLGVETTQRETVHPAVSAVMIGAGAILLYTGRRKTS